MKRELATRLGDAGDWNSVAGDRVRVGPRAVVKLPYVVHDEDVLRWEYLRARADVRFSVSERRMAGGGAVEVGLLPSASCRRGLQVRRRARDPTSSWSSTTRCHASKTAKIGAIAVSAVGAAAVVSAMAAEAAADRSRRRRELCVVRRVVVVEGVKNPCGTQRHGQRRSVPRKARARASGRKTRGPTRSS